MKYLISLLFFVPGLINFTPIIGSISKERLSRLYEIENLSSDLELLLRHRAFLFGIVGALIITAAFQTAIRLHAFIAGSVSMVSFVVLVFSLKTSNPSLAKVAWIDVFAIVLLVMAYLLHVRYS